MRFTANSAARLAKDKFTLVMVYFKMVVYWSLKALELKPTLLF